MMEKEKYEKLELLITMFDEEDVISTSEGGDESDESGYWGEEDPID